MFHFNFKFIYLLFYFCNVIRLSKRSLLFLFIYYYVTSNINIYVEINFHLLPLYAFTHALTRVFFMMPVNIIQHRWAVGNFNSYFNFHKLKSKSDSLLGICTLFKKIINLLFYIISHVVPVLLTFLYGLLTGKFHRKSNIFQSILSSCLIRLHSFMHFFWFYIKKIIISGDVETNPGPQSKRCQEFSICLWNLNSIATHSFIKVSLLKAYITIYNYDVICLSETYLDSSILSNDKNLEIPGYELIRADHPSNSKRGGVCVYYRNSLPLKIQVIFYLQDCIVFELKIGNKFCKIVFAQIT